MSSAKLIYDLPERNADLYYKTRFWAPDPFIFLEFRGKKFLILSDLEIDRAKKNAEVDRVLSLTEYIKRVQKTKSQPELTDVIHELLKENKIKELIVPGRMSFDLVDKLRRLGYRITAGPSPFYPERFCKTADEKKIIAKIQGVVFQAIDHARNILAKSRIKRDKLVFRGKTLTSEWLRQMINVFLLERGYVASDTIVSSGPHSIDPHDIGSGPLRPYQSIIFDVFPKSIENFYYADATRTFCRGRAPEALKKMYATVMEGQKLAISKVRSGVSGKKIHDAVLNFFAGRGYKTGERKGRMEGFFHSTGHSLGLELHEEPGRIGPRDFHLKSGNVITVEPGLYYPEIGGVRIEDVVYVTKTGCEILGTYPKHLEIR